MHFDVITLVDLLGIRIYCNKKCWGKKKEMLDHLLNSCNNSQSNTLCEYRCLSIINDILIFAVLESSM